MFSHVALRVKGLNAQMLRIQLPSTHRHILAPAQTARRTMPIAQHIAMAGNLEHNHTVAHDRNKYCGIICQ